MCTHLYKMPYYSLLTSAQCMLKKKKSIKRGIDHGGPKRDHKKYAPLELEVYMLGT